MNGDVAFFVLTAVLLPLAVNETGELAPWLAARLVRTGAKLLGSREDADRWTEEWLGNLKEVPGKITKLCVACGLVLVGVPVLRWQIRARARRLKNAGADRVSSAATSLAMYQARPYQARPARKVLVANDLADLRGPATGTLELPLRLLWHPDRTFDLGKTTMLHWMYQTVLREACRMEDLTSYLDGETLATVWRNLLLPRGVREAWEKSHPVLRGANM
jgi:hypothetical protein